MFDSIHDEWVELNPSQLHYTGFNDLNLLVDTFNDPPLGSAIYLTMIAHYCEIVTSRGAEINVYVPEYLNEKWLTHANLIHLEEEPKQGPFSKSKAKTFLEKKAIEDPSNEGATKRLAAKLMSGKTDGLVEEIQDLKDRSIYLKKAASACLTPTMRSTVTAWLPAMPFC